MSKRKILFFCSETYPPHYEFLEKVFNFHLPCYGYDTVWMMPASEALGIQMHTWEGRPAILIPKLRGESPITLFSAYYRHLRNIRKAFDLMMKAHGPFDLLQVRDDPAMAAWAHLAATRANIPWVYQISHLKEEEFISYARMGIYGPRSKNIMQGLAGLLLRNFLLGCAQAVFPISERMKNTLARYGIRRNKMVPVEEGADTSLLPDKFYKKAKQIRQRLGIRDEPVIIYVGTMNRFRRLEILLESFRIVLARHPGTLLLMVGEGRTPDDLAWLKRRSKDIGIFNNVVFTRHVSKQEVRVYIKAADIGVSPVPASYVYMSSSPIKVLEYLALETPVVGTDIPDQKFVIDNSRGGICVGWDAGELSEGINKLLELTREQRKLIGRKGRAWVSKNRDFSVLAQKVADTYDRLILAVGRSGSKEKKG